MATFDSEEARELLTSLVRIPSPYFEEEEIMRFALDWLRRGDVPAWPHRFHEEKLFDYRGVNVVGIVEGTVPGPTIILNGHLDTVKLCEGWTRDPFGAAVEGDRLYGLGACDMKGGVVAIMMALREFCRREKAFAGTILYSFVCDEEGPFGLGTDALILDGFLDGNADVAVITEPSSAFACSDFPCLCLGARGGWNYSVDVRGKSAHGAQPELGINAVSEAAKILLELERTPLPSHEKLGPAALCCIDFHGGGAALSVPDEAHFSVFRHVVVGETKDSIRREAEAAIGRAAIRGLATIRFRDAPHEACDGFPAYVLDERHAMVGEMIAAAEAVTGRRPSINYFSSVGDFCYTGGRLKVPTLVIGPKGDNFHGADEYVELKSVVSCAEILLHFLRRLTTAP